MMSSDVAQVGLTDAQWNMAHQIADRLAKEDTDVNELGKVIAYLRTAINQYGSNAGSQFFKYLKTLVKNGNSIGHSSKTIGYYRSIDKACSDILQKENLDAEAILQILGWAARLMRYYKVSPIGENAEPQEESVPSAVTERQAAIEALIQTQTFEVGQMIEAQVKQKLKGNKVTYLIGDLLFTEKEAKTFDRIPASGKVKVEIKSLKEDGSINHVKFVQS
ncbi:hypothetical protein [Thermocoleostomius sinensis]|uniref:Uncharacterized protein n=1 Tax=Thermocoleostomius sinensis A174 TaxID=2016057 RepID=A0A9E8ZDE0_9CYAN|nr:hypothetical protein [Thermocoleostomius sinensis]WAL59849.1 hypothetical protein OXH18_22185 [Thermocoleostomius sinensis A174]